MCAAALLACVPSGAYAIALMYDECPLSSFSDLPDFSPWTRPTASNEPETTCVQSELKAKHVTPSECAFVKRLTHCPVVTLHTLI